MTEVGARRVFGRRTLSAIGAVALAMPFVPSCAAASRRLRLAYDAGSDNALGAAAIMMVEQVGAATDGRLKIDIYPNATLGNPEAALAATRAGAIDLTLVSSGLLATFAPQIGLLDLPFLFRDAAHAHSVLDGPEGQEMADIAASKGMAVLAWGENGFRHLTANRPLRTAGELRGLKLRVLPSQVLIDAFRAMGADAKTIPFSQLYEALLTGRFEAEENPLPLILSARLYDVQKYVMLTGHAYSAMAIVASPDLLEDLAPPDRAVLIHAAKLAAHRSREFNVQNSGQVADTLKAKGMTILADIDRPSFLAALAPAQAVAAASFGADCIARLRGSSAP